MRCASTFGINSNGMADPACHYCSAKSRVAPDLLGHGKGFHAIAISSLRDMPSVMLDLIEIEDITIGGQPACLVKSDTLLD
jgi:hypothetical protein